MRLAALTHSRRRPVTIIAGGRRVGHLSGRLSAGESPGQFAGPVAQFGRGTGFKNLAVRVRIPSGPMQRLGYSNDLGALVILDNRRCRFGFRRVDPIGRVTAGALHGLDDFDGLAQAVRRGGGRDIAG